MYVQTNSGLVDVVAYSGTTTTGNLTTGFLNIVNKSGFTMAANNAVALANPVLSATAGTLYGQQLTAVGGTGLYDFTESGTLPAGITLSPTGLLSGTTTATGTYNFMVTATDSGSPPLTGSQQYTLTVVSPSNALVIGPGVLPPAAAGKAYPSASTSSADGGAGPLLTFSIVNGGSSALGSPTFSASNLPSWLYPLC